MEIGAGNPYPRSGEAGTCSGTAGPAAPATDCQATHTATVTPSATLTGSGPGRGCRLIVLLSAAAIPGIASNALRNPTTLRGYDLCDHPADNKLIRQRHLTLSRYFPAPPPSGLYLAYIALSPYAAAAGLGSVIDANAIIIRGGASAAAGVVVHAIIDYATG